MFPVPNGLYAHRSTINQSIKPGFPYLNLDLYPFTNANLGVSNVGSKPPFPNPSDGLFEYDLSNEDTAGHVSIKKPLSKAERRAEHNAIERARRETLNQKFQTLAQALPNLSNYRRPSKSQIVEKALEWVKQGIAREERYRYQVLQLQRENKRLLNQLMHIDAPLTSGSNLSFTDLSEVNGWSCSNPLMLATPQMTPNSSVEDLSITRPLELLNASIIAKIEEDNNESSGYDDESEYPADKASYSIQTPYANNLFMSSEVYPSELQNLNTSCGLNGLDYSEYPQLPVTGIEAGSLMVQKAGAA